MFYLFYVELYTEGECVCRGEGGGRAELGEECLGLQMVTAWAPRDRGRLYRPWPGPSKIESTFNCNSVDKIIAPFLTDPV